jgi:hypothetical protein
MVDWKPLPGIPNREYPPDWNRILSGTLAVVWLILSGIAAGVQGVLANALQIVLPCACIWFPDALGSLTTSLPGPLSDVPIERTSPGCAIRFFGWVALIVLTVGRVVIFVTMR